MDTNMTSISEKEIISTAWTNSVENVLDNLIVDPGKGLSDKEVQERQQKFGPNRLQTEKERSAMEIAIDQFKSVIILLLVVSALLSFIFSDVAEGIAIVVVIIINALIGFFTELRAVRSMEALRDLTVMTAKARRNGEVIEIDAKEIVPGDILILNGGDVITADARLIKASNLRINEASLTGESLPVEKQLESLSKETPLAERSNMVYKGSSVARGSGEAAVVNIGMETELGNISSLVQEAEEEITPLEERLDSLGRKLIYVTLGLVAIVALLGWGAGRDFRLMIETSIALAVASIPEGLPIVATIALARGMHRMAQKNALINKLSSVETLGATSVIISDKTGTLTENQMTVTQILLPEGEVRVSGEGLLLKGDFKWQNQNRSGDLTASLKNLIQVGVLCNNASLIIEENEVNEAVGEPMEIALKVVGHKANITEEILKKKMPETRSVAFDPETKMMATIHQQDQGEFIYAIKGSPEAVFNSCSKIIKDNDGEEFTDELKTNWREISEDLASQGLRVIGFARKHRSDQDENPYKDLSFLGLAGLMDPPREEVSQAIERCQAAGIRVIMATGDHGETARDIARSVNLVDNNDAYKLGQDLEDIDNVLEERRKEYIKTLIFARVSPEQKLDLIKLHQNNGEIVAMTGDGVNDAPALKKADIGIAMGERGTEVAKDAADMVLENDFFGTIVSAIEQGRVIFKNIRNFVLYLLSCNISEIIVVTIATVVDMPLPILPLQILYLNLVTDVFPALALGMGEGGQNIMEEPPRNAKEPIMTRNHWITMSVFGLIITGSVLGGMVFVLNLMGFSDTQATTTSFLILALAQLWHVFNMRETGSKIFINEITSNKYIWMALLLSVLLLLLAVYSPFMASVLSLSPPGLKGWSIILIASFLPVIVGQLLKEFKLIK